MMWVVVILMAAVPPVGLAIAYWLDGRRQVERNRDFDVRLAKAKAAGRVLPARPIRI